MTEPAGSELDPRIHRVRALVEELDRTTPTDDAGAIVFIEPEWDLKGRTKEAHYIAFLATPAGFVRFGLVFMRAAFATPGGEGQGGERVPLALEEVLKKDSNLDFLRCERVGPFMARPRRVRRPCRGTYAGGRRKVGPTLGTRPC